MSICPAHPAPSALFRFRSPGHWAPESYLCGRDGEVGFSYPEGHRQQDQIQGASEAALVLPDVPEAVPGRGKRARGGRAGGPAPSPPWRDPAGDPGQGPYAGGAGLGLVFLVVGAAQGEPRTHLSRAKLLRPERGASGP